MQRYNIFVTPFEVLVFKMSGKENYVDGAEANRFFSSIRLKKADNTAQIFAPKQGGFSIQLIQTPHENIDAGNRDGI